MRYAAAGGGYGPWKSDSNDPEAWRRIPPGTPMPVEPEPELDTQSRAMLALFWIIGFILCPPAMVYLWLEERFVGEYRTSNIPPPSYYADF